MKGKRKRQICNIILKTRILLFNSKCSTNQQQLRGKACWQFIRSGKTKTFSLKGWRIKISKHFNRLGKPRWKQHTCIWTHILSKVEESRGGIFTRLGKPHWKQAHTWCKNPWSRVRNHRAEEAKRTSFSSCTISAEGDNIVSMELHVFVWTWPIASHIAYLENSFTASGRLFDVSHVEKTWLFLTGVRLSTKSFIIGHWPGYETNYLFRHGVPNKKGF